MQTGYSFWKEIFEVTEEQFKEKLNFWLSLSPSARQKGNLPICQKNILAMEIETIKSQIIKRGGFVALTFGYITLFILNIWHFFLSLNPKSSKKEFVGIDMKYFRTRQLVRENKIDCCFELWMSEELEQQEKSNELAKNAHILLGK